MRHPIVVCIYAAAMGVLEAIVVIYLRRIYYPGGFGFPLVAMDPAILRAEVIREVMTLVMLGAVAWIAAERPWNRLLAFIVAFGVWDILYYAGLKLFLDWPASWLTPDILFLIPRVWIGPVLAPALVSASWIIGGLFLHRTRYADLGMGWKSWCAAIAGAAVILAAFLISGKGAGSGSGWVAGAGSAAGSLTRSGSLSQQGAGLGALDSVVPRFPWILFGLGYALGTGTMLRIVTRSRRGSGRA